VARGRASELLRGVPRPFAAFVLGSSCPSRRWFPGCTAEVADGLWNLYGYPAVLLGTGADRVFATDVTARAQGPVHDLVGRTTLQEVVSVLSEARVVISPDSGAMHIAAALGTPVVSLWGATSAARSAPYGFGDACLSGSAKCAPCYFKDCPIGRVCMESIRSGDVLARAAAIVDGSFARVED
jgi:ADP-heptose:LPS heptosyltransferase